MDPALRAVADAVAGSGLPPMVELDPDGASQRTRGALQSCAPGPEVAAVTEHSIAEHVTVRIYRPLARGGVGTVVHADYRLAPDARFHAAVDDAMAVSPTSAAALAEIAAATAGLLEGVVAQGNSATGGAHA